MYSRNKFQRTYALAIEQARTDPGDAANQFLKLARATTEMSAESLASLPLDWLPERILLGQLEPRPVRLNCQVAAFICAARNNNVQLQSVDSELPHNVANIANEWAEESAERPEVQLTILDYLDARSFKDELRRADLCDQLGNTRRATDAIANATTRDRTKANEVIAFVDGKVKTYDHDPAGLVRAAQMYRAIAQNSPTNRKLRLTQKSIDAIEQGRTRGLSIDDTANAYRSIGQYEKAAQVHLSDAVGNDGNTSYGRYLFAAREFVSANLPDRVIEMLELADKAGAPKPFLAKQATHLVVLDLAAKYWEEAADEVYPRGDAKSLRLSAHGLREAIVVSFQSGNTEETKRLVLKAINHGDEPVTYLRSQIRLRTQPFRDLLELARDALSKEIETLGESDPQRASARAVQLEQLNDVIEISSEHFQPSFNAQISTLGSL